MVQEEINAANPPDDIIVSISGLGRTEQPPFRTSGSTLPQHNQHLGNINKALGTISSTVDLGQASPAFLNAVQELVPCQITAVYSISQNDDVVSLLMFASSIPIPDGPGDNWPLKGSAVEQHLGIGAAHIQREFDQSNGLATTRRYLEAGIKSNLWAPIVNRGRTIGLLVLRSTDPRGFSDADVYWVRHLSHLMFPIIETGIHYRQMMQGQQFAQALNQVTGKLNCILDPAQVLEGICRECCRLLQVSLSILFNVSGGNTTRQSAWPPGVLQSEEPTAADRVISTLASKVIASGMMETNNQVSSPDLFGQQTSQLAGINAIMGVPIIDGGSVIGVLVIGYTGSHRIFTNQHADMAKSFSSHAATALQNARLHEEVQDYASAIALVDKVSEIITSAQNIDEVYQQFALEVKTLVDFDRAHIGVINRDSNSYVFKYFHGDSDRDRRVGDVIRLENMQTEYVVETGHTLVRENLLADHNFNSDTTNLALGIRSAITVPMISNSEVIGVLELCSHKISAYGPREQVILERLAGQISSSVKNAWLHQKLHDNSQEIAIIDEIAKVITTTLNIEEVYHKFAMEIKNLVDFDHVVINLVDQEASTFTRKHLVGIATPGLPVGSTSPLAGTQNERVVASGKTLVRPNIADDPQFSSDFDLLQTGMVSSILVPLTSKGTVIGTIGLHSSHANAFEAREQAILERLATQIAPAVETAQLYESIKLEKIRATDDLNHLSEFREALRESKGRSTSLFADSRDAIFVSTKEGQFLEINQSALDLFDYEQGELGLINCWDLFVSPQQLQKFQRELEQHGSTRDFKVTLRAKTGVELDCLATTTVHQANDGTVVGYQTIIHDITRSKQLEAQVLQSQKMESLGRLSSGIVHDFNNLLADILGFASLLKNRVEPETEAYEFTEMIEKATQRGSQLTRQLLTNIRKTPFETVPMDVNEVMQDVLQILSRTLPKGINIVSHFQPTLPLIPGDIGLIQQVLMNLCLNGADAMSGKGTLSLSNNAVYLSEEICRQHLNLNPGRYIQLAVTDTGMGISEENKANILEPFFTTKDFGKGTGLGLSVAYDIVKNHDGTIDIKSELGYGSSFTVYLPVCANPNPKIVN